MDGARVKIPNQRTRIEILNVLTLVALVVLLAILLNGG